MFVLNVGYWCDRKLKETEKSLPETEKGLEKTKTELETTTASEETLTGKVNILISSPPSNGWPHNELRVCKGFSKILEKNWIKLTPPTSLSKLFLETQQANTDMDRTFRQIIMSSNFL